MKDTSAQETGAGELGARPLRRRRSRQESLVSHERWLVSYADFMTLLFAFFVVLFATSRHSTDALGKLSGAIHSGFSGKASPPAAQTDAHGRDQAKAAARLLPQSLHGVAASNGSRTTHTGANQAANQGTNQGANQGTNQDMGQLAVELSAVLGDSIERREVSLQQTSEGLVISFQELGFFHSGEANLLPGQAETIVRAGAILQQHNLTLRVEGHSDDQPIHNAFFASNWELSAARAMTVLLLLVDQDHYDPTRVSMAGYGPYRPVADNTTSQGRQKNRRVDLVVVREQASSGETG